MYVTYTRIYGWSDYGGESSYQPGYRLENMMWMTLLVYDYIIPGEKVIDPKNLKELDTANVIIPYGADGAEVPYQKYRDVFKILCAMEDENAVYLLLGVENQSNVHYAMPVKNMVYDSLEYAAQVQKAETSHNKARKEKDPMLIYT